MPRAPEDDSGALSVSGMLGAIPELELVLLLPAFLRLFLASAPVAAEHDQKAGCGRRRVLCVYRSVGRTVHGGEHVVRRTRQPSHIDEAIVVNIREGSLIGFLRRFVLPRLRAFAGWQGRSRHLG